MATINLGAIKFNWKGAYAGGTAYTVDDVVSSGGSSYVCILASTGNAVSNGTYWEQMSSAGTNGTDGTDVGTTLTTQSDLLYRDGSGLQRLPKGTANQLLRINSGATAPEWHTPATVTSNLTDTAWLEYQDATARFRDLSGISGRGNGDRVVVPLNSLFDPYSIVNSFSGNQFTVTSTGAYFVDMFFTDHGMAHHKMYLYNDSDSKFAQRPTSNLTGADNYQSATVGYTTGQGHNNNSGDCYYLETGHNYTFRTSQDGDASFSQTTSWLYGDYAIGGVTTRNCVARVNLTKMSGV